MLGKNTQSHKVEVRVDHLLKKPDGGAGSLTRAVDKANNLRAAKRAQTTSSDDYASNAERKAAFKEERRTKSSGYTNEI